MANPLPHEQEIYEKIKKENPEQSEKTSAHTLQASFLAYFTALFFGFDTLSTYLILFLLIAYSLHLIAKQNQTEVSEEKEGHGFIRIDNQRGFMRIRRIYADIVKKRGAVLTISFVLLIWFIWQFNIKPFGVNSEINIAKYLVENGKCESGLLRMEKTLKQKSILDAYFRLKYATLLQ